MVKKNSFKYVIGYNDIDDISPLCMKLFLMDFRASDKKLL